ncbi:hypothetical protein [Burkholderia vietnamiensis]|nr:hypothetical protein [Burkholderia vietnamiensis]
MTAGSVWFQFGLPIEALGSNLSVTVYGAAVVSNPALGRTAR